MDWNKWVRLQWDRVGAWLCVAAGIICLVAAWVKASDTAYEAEQLPYILSGGVGGLFLLGLGAMLWLSGDLRDEWTALNRIERELSGRCSPPSPDTTGAGPDLTVEMAELHTASVAGPE